MDNKNTMLKKPEQIYQEELKSDLKDLMVGLSNEEKLKLAIEMMSQLGVSVPISLPEPVVEETTTTTTTEPEPPKDDSWFSSFEGLFIDNIDTKPKEESKEITPKPTEMIQKTPEITPTIEQKPEPTPAQVKTFTYEKPEGWNKKRNKTNIFKVIWDGILDRGMDAKDQQRYDNFRNNFFIVAIICLLIYVVIAFNSYKGNSAYNTNKSYMDRFINYCAEKYDKITGRDKITYTIKDTTKPVVIDTPKLLIKIDTPIVVAPVVPVVVEPKPIVKDTPVKKPVTVVSKNKKEILVEYIRTLPEYSKFGPMDLPYLTQDVNKVDWTFLRADGKSVHFHYNSLEGTFSVSQ